MNAGTLLVAVETGAVIVFTAVETAKMTRTSEFSVVVVDVVVLMGVLGDIVAN